MCPKYRNVLCTLQKFKMVLFIAAFTLKDINTPVAGEPQLTVHPTIKRISEETYPFFYCKVTNVTGGTPKLSWFSNLNKRVTSTNVTHRIYLGPRKFSSLMVHFKSFKRRDVGTWRCEAKIPGTKRLKSKTVEVVLDEIKIRFKNLKRVQEKVAGTNALIECEIISIHPPAVIWKKDGKYVNDMMEESRYIVKENGLLIQNITNADSGIYECGTLTGYQDIIKAHIKVTVRDGSKTIERKKQHKDSNRNTTPDRSKSPQNERKNPDADIKKLSDSRKTTQQGSVMNLKSKVNKTKVGLIVGGISAACGVVIILIGAGYYLTKTYMMDRKLTAIKDSKTSFGSNISFTSIKDN